MKRPNGYGSVYKLQGKRRKPYIAAITTHDDNGKRKKSAIGYYATRKEAEIALADYNMNPFDVSLTFAEVYKAWSEKKFPSLVSTNGYETAYSRCKPLYDRPFASLKVGDLETTINEADATKIGKSNIKRLFNQLYKYAVRYEIVSNNPAQKFSVETPKTKLQRKVFTEEEIKKLWDSDAILDKATLILIYTGLRVNELYYMYLDTDNYTFVGGSKTDSGKDRTVPVREKIQPFVADIKTAVENYVSRDAFYCAIFAHIKKMGHTPHDTRVTFVTAYKDCDVYAIKRIVGHKETDITKGLYTKYSVDDLREIIESVDF